MSELCATDAFYEQLKSLRIEDFPCGLGSWRQALGRSVSKYDSGGVQYESVEALLDLEKSSPYAVDGGWSKEAADLRKIAIETPHFLQDPSFVLRHFTTLRIIDKNVNIIDEGILKFVNLKELILSANHISKIDGKNLPKGLEVLELAANNVSDLSALKSANLCSLLHLGLAQNQVTNILPRSYTPSKWPSLLSLDLSYNNLSNLQSTVEILKHLPALRNLLLVGNPLHLAKCYHGFLIDSIPGLSYLDNQEVSADDKHRFKSFSKIKDLDVNNSYVTVRIIGINDVKNPVQIEDPEAGDFPKVEHKYHVEFMFMKDKIEKQSDITENIDGKEFEDTAANDSEGNLDCISTDNLLWAEMLEFDFCKTIKISELSRLRSFLKDGITFGVVAVKHSYVPDDPSLSEDQNIAAVVAGEKTQEKHAVKTSASKDRIKLDGKKSAKTKSAVKVTVGKEKGGKKDKRDVSELFELPQERKTVGTCHVFLASFLDGDTVVNVSSPCVEENTGGENDRTTEGDAELQSAKRSDDKRKGKGDGDKHPKIMPPAKGKTKSANPLAGKGNKGGKGKDKVEELSEAHGDEEAPPPPPPLSIKLEVKLERLTCTKDALVEDKS
ncbi:leucine-rich repeat-containing protein 43-like [Dendronephthya gigantea]|uniref:leucine-rich repeat-containing protein 43-like n=1 Tax=Dendronephthya gigantea TaxID=151771 RepID=UPI00106C7932|nr:leucine-rich repeat-containing protein 43-like [Dendronephthya gigantea]